MDVSHYAYNTLKMPGPEGVITIKADRKDAIFCVGKIYKIAAAATPDDSDLPSVLEAPRKGSKSSAALIPAREATDRPERSKRSL